MAELLLKINDGAGYRDGDVLCAFSNHQIARVHAEHICSVRRAGFKSDGLRPDGIALAFRGLVMAYRFERVNRTQVKRTRLADGNEELFGPEAIDVPLFIARRKKHAGHGLFGRPGLEVWFGGKPDTRPATVNLVWSTIQANTPYRQIEHRLWPLGRMDVRAHFPLAVDDFDDAELRRLTRPLRETESEESAILKRRRHKIEWRDVLGVSAGSIADILDRDVAVDRREQFSYSRDTVVTERAR